MVRLCLHLLMLVSLISLREVACRTDTLDDYCSKKLPETKRKTNLKTSVLEILRFCSDVDIYSDCILRARRDDYDKQGFAVKLFEKQFPSEYDLKRAAYMYCTGSVKDLYGVIMLDQKVFEDCEKAANTDKCEQDATSSEKLSELQAAYRANNQGDITKHSCRLSVNYMKCIQAEYTKCNSTFESFFLYKFARLGPSCLLEHKVWNKVILNDDCRKLNTSGQSGVRAGVCFVILLSLLASAKSLLHPF
ncbi:uncharacterized protein LOC131934035 [Physella acuta]|uniref:uncharacterized protein LOC131934035 n=1 Tax=Physella acuta TaxID=109671 RepID=UPI0027DABB26|nr:uncharacterized protein LOC131934035 [Physella acuta]